MNLSMPNNKTEYLCEICKKKIITWNPFNKGIKVVLRLKEWIWYEYYHEICLRKKGLLTKKKVKAGRWDKDDDEPSTSNLVH